MTVYVVLVADREIGRGSRIVKVFDSRAKADAFRSEPDICIRDPQDAQDEWDWSDFEVVVGDLVHGTFRTYAQAERHVDRLRARGAEIFTVQAWAVE